MSNAFPRCPLHGTTIVGELPDGCPFATPIPIEHVHEYNVRSYRAPGDDSHKAVVYAELTKTCGACVASMSAHPHVKYLRQKAGIDG
jgi:hypothetical protein